MKKIFLLSATALMMVASVSAQTSKKEYKQEAKAVRKETHEEKKEARKEKKELRKLEGPEVSYQAQQAFQKDFSNVLNPSWERSAYFDKVTFTNKHGKRVTAYYDYDAELVGTTVPKNFSDLPANAQKFINNKYSGYSKGEVFFFHDNQENESDMVLFGDSFGNADNYFIALHKGVEEIVLRADMNGNVNYFKRM